MTTTHSQELPQFLRDMISSPPTHGEGVHQWLFRVARQLHHHRDHDEIAQLLEAATIDCGRTITRSEIEDAVTNSQAAAWRPGGATTAIKPNRPKWPSINPDKIREIVWQDPFALARLDYFTPVTVSTDNHDPECLLERLFPGNPLLCVATSVKDAITALRKELPRLEKFSHIVPSAMSKPEGTNQQGKPSVRCLDNVGPRSYLVTEFDQGDHGQQSAIIRHLSRFAPLVMVVDSAGKSYHAWWHCSGKDESATLKFFKYAVTLGADPATWTKCQLVRMPLGLRPDPGRRQEVVFFDHTNTQTRKGGCHE